MSTDSGRTDTSSKSYDTPFVCLENAYKTLCSSTQRQKRRIVPSFMLENGVVSLESGSQLAQVYNCDGTPKT
ncbi:hypothetical protein F442_05660 [Phytophthora nicotianae P10297]|nr:hypothetical protein PPTG_22573 [Phytophthora nicotianae INRA-310]ETN11307.1 hypothetical protein PPTG_22573 [Phytophthora nicotianae INRA-310]ETP48647.1 hypothetical protein F442_05660 [Phytophthora nicotianae P10297]